MGTSTNFTTPTGGDWSDLKRDITDLLNGDDAITPEQIIGGTLLATQGFGKPLTVPSSASPLGGVRSGGRRAGGGTGGGGARTTGGRLSVGRAASGLGGFGATVRDEGLDAALEAFGLGELHGKPAAEVIARIAEHMTEDLPGTQGEILTAALRESIFEVAALEGDRSYQALEASLQAFLNREGVEGLVECFLSRIVFNRVWFHVEAHVQKKADGAEGQALAAAVERSIKGHVRSLIDEQKTAGRFNRLDWFGAAGDRFGQDIAADLEARLRALHTPRS
jgi:hypothetical protein